MAHMETDNQLDPALGRKMDSFKNSAGGAAPDLSPGKARFMLEAAQMAGAVTKTSGQRHNLWLNYLQNCLFIKKDKKPMLNALAILFMIATIVFGGGTATVAAAQSSQPDQLLYNVKLMSEDVLQQFTTDPQKSMELSLNLASRRMEEIKTMAAGGKPMPVSLLAGYRERIEEAVQVAAGLPQGQVVQALENIQVRLADQVLKLQQAAASSNSQGAASVEAARVMLQEHLEWMEQGKNNPAMLKGKLPGAGNGLTLHTPTAAATGTLASIESGQDGTPATEGTPASSTGNGYGQFDGNGDGDGVCETCTPGANSQGGNPYAVGTPTPGSGYGPGPGTGSTLTCTPLAPQDGTGQQYGKPQSGGSGSSGSGSGNGNGSGGGGGKGGQ
jgi:hypothetical protein